MDNRFIRVDEVAAELDVSKPYAYKLIRKLNEELKGKGFLTIAGRVNRQYFNERFFGTERMNTDSNAGFPLHRDERVLRNAVRSKKERPDIYCHQTLPSSRDGQGRKGGRREAHSDS